MAPTILLATLVSFVADVSLEILLVTSVGEAAVAVATVKAELLVLGEWTEESLKNAGFEGEKMVV